MFEAVHYNGRGLFAAAKSRVANWWSQETVAFRPHNKQDEEGVNCEQLGSSSSLARKYFIYLPSLFAKAHKFKHTIPAHHGYSTRQGATL